MNKTFIGKVVSVAMTNTVVVEVFRKTPHKLYKKLITRSKRYKVDPVDNKVAKGDMVKIEETRPHSKSKYFKISEVVEREELA
jgi:small subunit ribosomal protein S17